LEAVLGIGRATFTSQVALKQFARLGFLSSARTQSASDLRPAADRRWPQPTVEEASAAFATLVAFLRAAPFTMSISTLEHALLEANSGSAAKFTTDVGLTEELLNAALVVRRDVGRVNDVIHATVIALALPAILEEGEVITNRPSLGAGNDRSRPFDLETNRRIAEFKVALWSGGDMMRKRAVTADLVHLAMDESGRRPELWLAGTEPIRFLRTSSSPLGSLLSRSSRRQRTRYEALYSNDLPLATFVAQHAAHVHLRDLAEVLPAVAALM
ncbi:MAG TPA: hypothetical protein VM347_05380, partial [Nonomuraea sp.]|nr:hypothetical protein [Nonomuraea sp.]